MASARRNPKTGAWEVRAYAGKDPVTGKVRNLSDTLPPDAPPEDVEAAKARLDGAAAFCKSSRVPWTVPGLLAYDLAGRAGENRLVIEVATTLERQCYPLLDGYRKMLAPKPTGGSGLTGTVALRRTP